MDELCWLNGKVLPLAEATVSIEDRGFQFADGVYEAMRVYGGRTFALREHLDRLQRSAAAVFIRLPIARDELERAIRELIARQEIAGDGLVYLQLTRGPSKRNHLISQAKTPTLLFYVRPLPPVPEPGTAPGTKLHSVPDERWQRCWIKSIGLLPNALAKSAAADAGADEAIFIHDGVATEGASTNLFVVIAGTLVTHPVGAKVLPGVTRDAVLRCTRELGINIEERGPSEREAKAAQETFITSTTREIAWVSTWDGQPVGEGECGQTTLELHRALQQHIKRAMEMH
jgi:D-alanine transaminase